MRVLMNENEYVIIEGTMIDMIQFLINYKS